MSPTTEAPGTAAPAASAGRSQRLNASVSKANKKSQANGHQAPQRLQPKRLHTGSQPPQKNGSAAQKHGSAAPSAALKEWRISFIPIDRIELSPYQPRLTFDAGEMAELVASVRSKGVQQPVIVRTCKTDQPDLPQASCKPTTLKNGAAAKCHDNAKPNVVRYELIAGERRLRACKEAKRHTIPAIIRDDLSDAECAELALLENVQRSNLSVIEEAAGYKRLMLQFRMTEERIAKKVGKSVATIREMLKVLQLPAPVQKLLAEKKLTASHGQELLRLAPFERICILAAERAARDHLTARSLQTTPLPNILDLKRLKLVAELDYKTKFDWRNECGQCPFKAYVPSGFGSYCLKPEEWKKKQTAAIEQAQQEASRIMEEARQGNGQPLEANSLTPGSFRHLTHAEPPAGCTEACPCRSEMRDTHDPTRCHPICLDPTRYNELVQAQRQSHEDARRQQYLALWEQAKATLQGDVDIDCLDRLVALLSLPMLQAQFFRYMDGEQWEGLARSVSAGLGMTVPWDEVLGDEQESAELYPKLQAQLQTQKPAQLLLLCGCLLLAHEVNEAVRFASPTPQLDFVLGRCRPAQAELPPDEVSPHPLTPDAPDAISPVDEVISAGGSPDEVTADKVTADKVTTDKVTTDKVIPNEVAICEVATDAEENAHQ